MGAWFWIKRFFLVYVGVSLVLLLSERIKGHGWRGALTFSALWAVITTTVFIATRMYYSRRGVACPVCQDTPE